MKTVALLMLAVSLAMANESALQEFTAGNNLFTAALYKEVLKEHTGNFLVSPLSAETVLALTQSGAKGATAAEIRSGLRLPDSAPRTEEAFRALLPTIRGNNHYTLSSANKIYVKKGTSINPAFQDVATQVYESEVSNIDFSAKDAAPTINSWVEKQTNGKIRDLVDPSSLDSFTTLLLINALYFKGSWVTPFASYTTRKEPFFRTATDKVSVDMMHGTDLYNYYESAELNAKFLELPYEGDDVSMVVVVPNEKEGLAALEANIENVFREPKFKPERVQVSLPKFTIESKIKMNDILKRLGVLLPFSGDGDLSGIAGQKGDLVVKSVLQKTFINVTETGTEAAAATVVIGVDRIGTFDSLELIADHPFLFSIILKKQILFTGRITNL